jgi:23S rRNA (cytidine2498-2'-O)-methyltransferase
VPPEAPSRAYRKLEEALAWSGAPVRAGDVAFEIGCAPGGASYALLHRGVHVVGVDPAPVSSIVAAFPGPATFRHLKMPVGAVPRAALPPRVEWLVLDVSLAPQVALRSIQRFIPPFRKTLRGALLTLKLNDWKLADQIPALLERVRALGFREVRATQLPSNRQEFFVCAAAR